MSGVVVGVDRSETARAAAAKAADLARQLGEPLHVVMAMQAGRTKVIRAAGDEFVLDWVDDARLFLGDLVRGIGAQDATVSIGGADPARAICDLAERIDASLVVVGNRRVQGTARVLGSIASDVLRKAPCDVFVAHTTSARDGAERPASPSPARA